MVETIQAHKKIDKAGARARAIELLGMVGIPQAAEAPQELPAPVLRRHAPARDDRDGAGPGAQADDRGRADDGARRDDPGPGPGADQRGSPPRPGTSLILITHDLGVVAGMTDRINVMYAGFIVETATTGDLFERPSHPYTVGLLHSMPRLDAQEGEPLIPIEGRPPDMRREPRGCPFAPRCAWRVERCWTDNPALEPVTAGTALVTTGPAATHRIACHNPPLPDEAELGQPDARGPRARARARGRDRRARLARRHRGRRRVTAQPRARSGSGRRRPGRRTPPAAARRSSRSGTSRCSSRSPRACCSSATSATSAPSTACRSSSSAARPWAWSASRAAARARPGAPSSGSTSPPAGSILFDGQDISTVDGKALRAAPPAVPDDLPGPVRLAQPADDGRGHDRRAAGRPQRGHEGRAAGAGPRPAVHRGPEPGLRRPLPARVLRRPAAAHRRGPGARAGPGPDRRRRADLRPRRLDPGAGHQPARAAPGSARA